jgi:RimJ/RimL family protein N-acetyltransferase
MQKVHSSTLPLFSAGSLHAFELSIRDVRELQEFFEANPEYFVAVTGLPPRVDEAEREITESLPDGWSFTKKWLIAFRNQAGSLVGMANIASDLISVGVWHIGLFVVATQRHGSGEAHALYLAMQSWAESGGAKWLRLGVVQGNRRAERFWSRLGFAQVRTRDGVEMGDQINTLRVLAKPLKGGTLADYLRLIARDRPEPVRAPGDSR